MDADGALAQTSLFDQFSSFENLLRAYRDAAREKRGRPDTNSS